MPVFDKIYWETEENTGVLRVGFVENTSMSSFRCLGVLIYWNFSGLYSDEELTKAAEAVEAAVIRKHASQQTNPTNEGTSTKAVS